MPFTKSRVRPRDLTRVNADDAHDLSYWCEKWQVPPEQIISAVRRVGQVPDDVAGEIGESIFFRRGRVTG